VEADEFIRAVMTDMMDSQQSVPPSSSDPAHLTE
jgi:hypothetical protein